MIAVPSQQDNTFLLLLLFDGRLCCFSALDGTLCWTTQIPGGSLYYCGEKCVKTPQQRSSAAALSSSVALHSRGNMYQRCTQKTSTDDLAFISGKCFSKGLVANSNTQCCIAFSFSGDSTQEGPFVKWCFCHPSQDVDKEHVWLSASALVQRWNASVDSAHRVVELHHKTTSYMEFDFFTGRQLLYISSKGKVDNGTEEQLPDHLPKVRITVERADFARNLFFPSSLAFLHAGIKPTEKRTFSGFWNALTSTVTLDVQNITDDNESCRHLPHEKSDLFYIEQRLKANEFITSLHVRGDLETVGKIEFTDFLSPVVSAYIVLFEPPLCAADDGGSSGDYSVIWGNTETSKVRCQEIRIVNRMEETEGENFFMFNLQDKNGIIKMRFGFFDKIRRVIFLKCTTPQFEDIPHLLDSKQCEAGFVNSLLSRSSNTSNNGEHDFFSAEIHSEETSLFVHSESSDNALVLKARSRSFSDDNDANNVISLDIEPSFFNDNFEVFQLLGRGSSGAVFLVRHRMTGVFYAIKILLLPKYFSGDDVCQEARLHALFENNNLVRYHASWSERITKDKLLQLASVGLCSLKELRRLGISGGASKHVECVGYQCPVKCKVNYNAGLPLFSDKLSMGQNLLLAPPHLAQEGCSNNNGLYLAGTDSLDSSYFATYRDDVASSNKSNDNDGGYVKYKDGGDVSSETAQSLFSLNGSEGFLGGRMVFLQLEYCHTTLAQRLGSRTEIDRIENIIIAVHIFSALSYLHRCGYLHRDVKPTNVFLDYRCQTATMDDTIDDFDDFDDNEDCNDDNGGDGKEDVVDVKTETNGGVVLDEAYSEYVEESGVMTTTACESVSRGFSVPAFSAYELIRRNASIGSLASMLEKLRNSKKNLERHRVARALRKWLMRHFVYVRLGDFGLSKMMSGEKIGFSGYFDCTEVNTVGVGSPQYSSPEQLNGDICTGASDAFSAGVLLAEMYIQPKTVAERLFELRRARQGAFPDQSFLSQYPELRVVSGLTCKDPNARITLKDASKVLLKTMDEILLSFFF